MTCRSNEENKIVAGDIFLSKHLSVDNKTLKEHYFVCLYSQVSDSQNVLTNDIVGAIITANPKYTKIVDEYVVKVYLSKPSYICVDKQFRFSRTQVTYVSKLPQKTMDEVMHKTKKFFREVERQIDTKKVFRR